MEQSLFITDKTQSSNNNNIVIKEINAEDFNLGTTIEIMCSCSMIKNEYNNYEDDKKSYYNAIILDNEDILKMAELIKKDQIKQEIK